jgi:hypothetical protein
LHKGVIYDCNDEFPFFDVLASSWFSDRDEGFVYI